MAIGNTDMEWCEVLRDAASAVPHEALPNAAESLQNLTASTRVSGINDALRKAGIAEGETLANGDMDMERPDDQSEDLCSCCLCRLADQLTSCSW